MDGLDSLLEDIREQMEEYIDDLERELRECRKNIFSITQGWNGYEITIAGHRVTAEHDSSQHRWRFRLPERDYSVFFDISEKKGQAIVDFLIALSRAINSSPRASAASEETFY